MNMLLKNHSQILLFICASLLISCSSPQSKLDVVQPFSRSFKNDWAYVSSNVDKKNTDGGFKGESRVMQGLFHTNIYFGFKGSGVFSKVTKHAEKPTVIKIVMKITDFNDTSMKDRIKRSAIPFARYKSDKTEKRFSVHYKFFDIKKKKAVGEFKVSSWSDKHDIGKVMNKVVSVTMDHLKTNK